MLSKGLKKVGKGLKSVGKKVGKAWEKVDDYVLPAAGFALGGPAGAALGSAAARGIGDGKFDAGATLGAGVKGYAGGQLASSLGLVGDKGFGALLNSGKGLVSGGGGGMASSASMASGGASGAAQAASGGGGGFVAGGRVGGGGVGDFLRNNPELILGAVSAFQGANQQSKADALNKRSLALAEQPWNETAALRQQSLKSLMNQQRPDLSHLYAGSSNPFSRPLRSL